MRLSLTLIALVTATGAACAGEVLFSDGFDEALSAGSQRPSCPPWTRAGAANDDPVVASTVLEPDRDNRFGEGSDAAIAILSDFSPEKQAYLLGNDVFNAKAVVVEFDFVEAEGPANGGPFIVNLGGGDGKALGDVALRIRLIKGALLKLNNSYQVEQKVHVKIVANNDTAPLSYEGQTLPSRTFSLWLNDDPVIEAQPFNEEGSTITAGSPLTTIGFLTFSGQTTAQKFFLKNIKVSSAP